MFKKLLIPFIFLIAVACGVLVFFSPHFDDALLRYLVIGIVCGSILLFVLIPVIVAFYRSYKQEVDLADWSDPNTVFKSPSTYVVAEYVFGRSIFGFRVPPKKAKILSFCIQLFLICTFFFGISLFFLQAIVPAVICLTLFGLTFTTCMFAAVIRWLVIFVKSITNPEEENDTRPDEKVLKKFESGEYRVAKILACANLPATKGEKTDGEGKYKYLIEVDWKRYAIRHTAYYRTGTHAVVYFNDGVPYIEDSKTRELQQKEIKK